MTLRTVRMISIADIGRNFGIRESTLRSLRSRGEGPEYFQLGRRIVYDADGFAAWLESRRVQPSAHSGDRVAA